MKNSLILLSIILASCFMTSCSNNYDLGQKEFDSKNYDLALNFLKKVPEGDENFITAQTKIAEIENIQSELLKAQIVSDSIAGVEELAKSNLEKKKKYLEKIEKLKTQIKNEIKSVSTFNGDKYRVEVSDLQIEVALFGSWAKIILDAEKSGDSELINDGKILKNKLVLLQKSEFPKLRKRYCDIVKQKLWADNIEASGKGSGFTTLEFIGATFANNKNKEDTQKTLSEILNQLRFKRVNYKWYKQDDEYTYYTLSTLSDSELITF